MSPLRCLAVLALLSAAPASADVPKLLAVLPLDARNAPSLDATSKATLEEAIRTIAGDALSPHGYTVLTGDNTLSVLADNGVDAEKACEASCALAAAKELKARLFVSGSVGHTEGAYVAFVRLSESESGRQLGSLQLEGSTVREVRQAFAQQAPALFRRALGDPAARDATHAGTTTTTAPERPTNAIVRIETEPAGLAFALDGRPWAGPTELTLPPGQHRVALLDRCRSAPEQAFSVRAGERSTVRLTSRVRQGRLSVRVATSDGEPVYAGELWIDGERISSQLGDLDVPVCSRRLEVRAGGETFAQALTLEEGETTELSFELAARSEQASPRGPARFALRGGFGPHTGVLGGGLAVRVSDGLWLAAGTGTYRLGIGVSFLPATDEDGGGVYTDGHVVWAQPGPLGERVEPGFAIGATFGYDWRPVRWLSLKAGAGVVPIHTGLLGRRQGGMLAFDGNLGVLF